jgi:16S rRNA C1402 N4-methylase RsmH
MRHRPVLLREVLTAISGMNEPNLVIDATFGGGGHSKAILGMQTII